MQLVEHRAVALSRERGYPRDLFRVLPDWPSERVLEVGPEAMARRVVAMATRMAEHIAKMGYLVFQPDLFTARRLKPDLFMRRRSA